MEKIIGLINAPFTPFYEDGEVNYEPIPAYAEMLQKNGLKGVFINGSSGEGYMLTEEERINLAEVWMHAAPKDFKVIVHVGSTGKSSEVINLVDKLMGLGLHTVHHLGAVDHSGAGMQLLTHHRIQRGAGLSAQQLGGLQNGVVHCGQLQHIGLGDEVAVLLDGGIDAGHRQAPTVGRHTLRQRLLRLGQRSKLAELDGLAAIGGNGTLLTELLVNEVCTCKGDKCLVIEGLHLSAEAVGIGDNTLLHSTCRGIKHLTC